MKDLRTIRLGLDELEAMRLCDLENEDQRTAGRRMGVTRGTVQRLLGSGRAKLLRALLDSAALVIDEESHGVGDGAPDATRRRPQLR